MHGIVRNYYKTDAKLEMDFNFNVITLAVTLKNLAHTLMEIEMDDCMYNIGLGYLFKLTLMYIFLDKISLLGNIILA